MNTQNSNLTAEYPADTTAAEVVTDVRLDGKTVVITGGYSGIGLEVTRALAGVGATIVVPARSGEKAWASLLGIPGVTVAFLDLLRPDTIETFARDYRSQHGALDLLINCAGIMASPLHRDARGHESHLSANHLGHFELTQRLWPALQRAGGSRVINLSSRGHQIAPFDFNDPDFNRRPYDKWKAYGQSKTANVLFSVALDARGREDGIRSFAVHPGRIMSTGLLRHLDRAELVAQGALDADGNVPLGTATKSPEQGAATVAWCATSSALRDRGGIYCEDLGIAPVVDGVSYGTEGVRPYAVDTGLAESLWTLSEAMVGGSGLDV